MDATSPATGESLGSVSEGTREDAERAIAAANAAWRDWAARSAFERAEAMERIAAVIAGRRDDVARTLTLDQGKPLKAEAHDEVDELEQYWLMAAADAGRLEGSMPPLSAPRQARARLSGSEGRRRGHYALELAVHDAGRGDRARARGGKRRDLGAGRRPRSPQ
jgi:acyl-CoA reductase-like NAD-dependent aldehyde dehydrogenase